MSDGSSKYLLEDVIFTQEQIETRAAEIGRQISLDYAGEEILVIGILRGAVMWMTQLIKSITVDTEIDFMAVSSYGNATKSSGIVKINKDLESSITGKHVIIAEDIVDSGVTLNYLKEYLEHMEPASIKICTLLDKPSGRKTDLEIDYIGFTVADVFIVGYGLDVGQKFRNLPYITSVVIPKGCAEGGAAGTADAI
ncbi:MAG: hypoxanthine phosphoribosyltransferase [Clostridiales Family XIII bacterium]|jgi:hypoxanthine phosphoribosyltransferase|nr:hypoxanthine phosphoribosyltransferase [Clostridiales Family XIII bacterium]